MPLAIDQVVVPDSMADTIGKISAACARRADSLAAIEKDLDRAGRASA